MQEIKLIATSTSPEKPPPSAATKNSANFAGTLAEVLGQGSNATNDRPDHTIPGESKPGAPAAPQSLDSAKAAGDVKSRHQGLQLAESATSPLRVAAAGTQFQRDAYYLDTNSGPDREAAPLPTDVTPAPVNAEDQTELNPILAHVVGDAHEVAPDMEGRAAPETAPERKEPVERNPALPSGPRKSGSPKSAEVTTSLPSNIPLPIVSVTPDNQAGQGNPVQMSSVDSAAPLVESFSVFEPLNPPATSAGPAAAPGVPTVLRSAPNSPTRFPGVIEELLRRGPVAGSGKVAALNPAAAMVGQTAADRLLAEPSPVPTQVAGRAHVRPDNSASNTDADAFSGLPLSEEQTAEELRLDDFAVTRFEFKTEIETPFTPVVLPAQILQMMKATIPNRAEKPVKMVGSEMDSLTRDASSQFQPQRPTAETAGPDAVEHVRLVFEPPPPPPLVRSVAMDIGDEGSQVRVVIRERNGSLNVQFASANERLREDLQISGPLLMRELQRHNPQAVTLDFSNFGSATDSDRQEQSHTPAKKSLKSGAEFAGAAESAYLSSPATDFKSL